MFHLRAEGKLAIICAVMDQSEVMGIGVLNSTAEEASMILDQDPNVKAGRLIYETHACFSFPGDRLPD